jgi:hypothetical protein
MRKKFGERITTTEAQGYFDAYDKVKKVPLVIAAPTMTPGAERNAALANTRLAKTYQKSTTNAFVFKLSVVKQLLSLKDNKGKLPEYLMVHFATKPKGDPEEGEPTIVLLTCNRKRSGKSVKYVSMADGKPAVETPGTFFIAGFPAAAQATGVSDNPIVFVEG